MPNTSAANGKAFEYACLEALHQAILKRGGNSSIKENKAYITAKKFYESKDKNTQEEYQKDANLGIDIILPGSLQHINMTIRVSYIFKVTIELKMIQMFVIWL